MTGLRFLAWSLKAGNDARRVVAGLLPRFVNVIGWYLSLRIRVDIVKKATVSF